MPPRTLAGPVGGRSGRSSRMWVDLNAMDGLDDLGRIAVRSAQTPSFVRGGTVGAATTIDANGAPHPVGSQQPRVYHSFDAASGLWVPRGWLIEGSRANRILRSEEFDNAAWMKEQSSVSTNADLAPNGTLTADRIVEDATPAQVHALTQAVTITADASVAWSKFLKAGSRSWVRIRVFNGANQFGSYFNLATGAIGNTVQAGTGVLAAKVIRKAARGYYRCGVVGSIGSGLTAASATTHLSPDGTTVVYDGDGSSYVSGWGGQLEDNVTSVSEYMPTTSGIVTRSFDQLTLPFNALPKAMTIYVKLHALSSALTSNQRVIQICDSAPNTNSVRLITDGSGHFIFVANSGGAEVNKSAAAAIAVGDTVELRAILYDTGAVALGQALNGGAEVVTTDSAAQALPATWGSGGAVLCAIGMGPNVASHGFAAFQAVRIAAGVQSLAYMRAA